jgi:hypothetical protein
MNCGVYWIFGYAISGKKLKHTCLGCLINDKLCAFVKRECNTVASKQIEYCFECSAFPYEILRVLDKYYTKNMT